MRKKILIGAIAILVVTASIAAWYVKRSFERGLYVPGRLGADVSASLEPPSQDGVPSGFWKVEEGVTLRHFEDGQGRAVLVLHGGPGFPSVKPWTGLKQINSEFKFHYFHQRGCGESTRPVQRFDSRNYYSNMQQLDRMLGIGTLLADIERIRRLLNQEKIILIGHSYGGFLAALYAAEFPGRVDRLVLIAPANTIRIPQEDGGLFEEVKRRLPEGEIGKYDEFMKRYLDYGNLFNKDEKELAETNFEFGRYMTLAYESAGNPPPQATLSAGLVGGWITPAQFLGLGRKCDLTPALHRITCPVLILCGDRDLMPASVGESYRMNLSNCRTKTIAGAGHFIFEERPDEFAQAVKSFLKE